MRCIAELILPPPLGAVNDPKQSFSHCSPVNMNGIARQAIPAHLLYGSGLGSTTSGFAGSAAHS